MGILLTHVPCGERTLPFSLQVCSSATYAIKTYIESNPDGMFTNESDVAELVQLYTEIQQTPPTVPFRWRVWEVKDDGKRIKKVCLSLSI